MADGKKIRKYLLRIVEILFSVALLVMLAVSLILATWYNWTFPRR